MIAFYRCPYCGFISTEPEYCPACLSEKPLYIGHFKSIEDTMEYAQKEGVNQ